VDSSTINPKHKDDYEAEIKNCFAGDPLIHFVQDLRNYMLHRSIPWTGMRVSRTVGVPTSSSVHIDLSAMEPWKGWTAPSKVFIEQHKPELKIQELVDSYETKIREFYEHFLPDFEKRYQGDIETVRTLWRRWNAP
jgi:hypothetical protein